MWRLSVLGLIVGLSGAPLFRRRAYGSEGVTVFTSPATIGAVSHLRTCPFPSCSCEGRESFGGLGEVSHCPSCLNLIVRCQRCSTFNRSVAEYCRSCGSSLEPAYKNQILAQAQSDLRIPIGQYFGQGEPQKLQEAPRHVAGQSFPKYSLVPAGGMLLVLGGEGGMHLVAEPFSVALETQVLNLPLAKSPFPWGGFAYGRYVFLPTDKGLHRLEVRGLVPELYEGLRREQRLNELVTLLGPPVLSGPAVLGRRFAYISESSPTTLAVVDLHTGSSGIAKLGSGPKLSELSGLTWIDESRLLLATERKVFFVEVEFPANSSPRPRLRSQVELPPEIGALRSPAVAGTQLYGIDDQGQLCRVPLSTQAMHTVHAVSEAEDVHAVWQVRMDGSRDELICPATGKTFWVKPGSGRQVVRALDGAATENMPPSPVGGNCIAMVVRLAHRGHHLQQSLLLVKLSGTPHVVRSEEQSREAFLSQPVACLERLFAVILQDSRPNLIYYDLTPEDEP